MAAVGSVRSKFGLVWLNLCCGQSWLGLVKFDLINLSVVQFCQGWCDLVKFDLVLLTGHKKERKRKKGKNGSVYKVASQLKTRTEGNISILFV